MALSCNLKKYLSSMGEKVIQEESIWKKMFGQLNEMFSIIKRKICWGQKVCQVAFLPHEPFFNIYHRKRAYINDVRF